MEVIAHRGSNREAPENSWEAFERSVDVGVDRIELDIQLTADQHVVVMHDTTYQRTTGVAAKVKDLTRFEAEKLRLENGERVPFLDELLSSSILAQTELNIEMKGDNLELAWQVGQMIDSHPLRDKILISASDIGPLTFIADTFPHLALACLHGRYFHWPHFGHLAPQVFMQQVRCSTIHPHVSLVNEAFMDQARSRGWKVVPFCSFHSEEDTDPEGLWSEMATYGIDGLCTNYPREFKQWLEEIKCYDHPAA